MASMNISLKKEAYEFLKSLKTRESSFSEVVLALKEKTTEKKGSKEAVLKFFGVLADKTDWDETEKRMKAFRKEFEERLG